MTSVKVPPRSMDVSYSYGFRPEDQSSPMATLTGPEEIFEPREPITDDYVF